MPFHKSYVAAHYVYTLISVYMCACVGTTVLYIYIYMYYINARAMDHIKI